MGNFNLEQHQLTVAEVHRNLAPSGARVWLVNTGWGGGACGTGKRISLKQYESGASAEIKAAGPA